MPDFDIVSVTTEFIAIGTSLKRGRIGNISVN